MTSFAESLIPFDCAVCSVFVFCALASLLLITVNGCRIASCVLFAIFAVLLGVCLVVCRMGGKERWCGV